MSEGQQDNNQGVVSILQYIHKDVLRMEDKLEFLGVELASLKAHLDGSPTITQFHELDKTVSTLKTRIGITWAILAAVGSAVGYELLTRLISLI